MPKTRFPVIVIFIAIVLFGIIDGRRMPGFYNPESIIGYIRPNAVIKVTATNVFIVDWENDPVRFGVITNSGGNMIWEWPNKVKWRLLKTPSGLMCVDIADTNTSVLLRKARVKVIFGYMGKVLNDCFGSRE